MANEIPSNPTKLFPSFNKWSDFLHSQDVRSVDFPSIISTSPQSLKTAFRTKLGIKNTLEFNNAKFPKSKIFNPVY